MEYSKGVREIKNREIESNFRLNEGGSRVLKIGKIKNFEKITIIGRFKIVPACGDTLFI